MTTDPLIEEARRLVEIIQAGEHRDRELIIYVMVRLASELEQAQQELSRFTRCPECGALSRSKQAEPEAQK